MYVATRSILLIVMLLSFSLAGPAIDVSAQPLAVATAPTLGAANSFAILAGSAITDVPTSAISGNVGLSPAAGTSYAGLTTGEVPGSTIYAVDVTGPAGLAGNNPGLLTNAQAANTAAFGALIAGPNAACTSLAVANFDLSGSNLVAGVYCAGTFTLTGTLTLVGTGVWIFQSGSTLITAGTANVVGGTSCSVWWRVPSAATLGTGTQLTGNILALSGIQLQSGATLNGRALVQNPGAVTLDGNTVARGALCTATTTTTGGGVRRRVAANAVVGLPSTGGAPIRNNDFPWVMALSGVLSVIALVSGLWAFGRAHLPKQ